ncbi:MAG: LuxR family transcriptional regulator [Pseudomonadota bacterium]
MWALMRSVYNANGFDKISYHHMSGSPTAPMPVEVGAMGFDDRWVCHYIREKLFMVDPITELALRATEPFFWSQINELVQLTPDQRGYLAQMEAAGLGNGLAFQVFGPGMRNGYVGLGFSDPANVPDGPKVHEMQFIAQAGHIRYCALVPLRSTDLRLSPREQDVLRWIARGKSNSVIADILGLSPHTVDTLMRRVFRKLGTSDRTTAAIEGLGAGLILP